MVSRWLVVLYCTLAYAVLATGCAVTYNLSGEITRADGEVSHGQETEPTENSGLVPLERSN